MLAASSRSNRRVYSSTAASPRACTSARMSVTTCSIAASASADQCRRALNSASKVAEPVDRRAGAAFRFMARALSRGRDGRLECVDDAADRFALELERSLVDDQPCADVHDAFDLDQLIGFQGIA